MKANGECGSSTPYGHSAETEELARTFDERPAQLPNVELFNGSGHVRPLHEIHKDVLAIAMRHYRGRTTQAARALGIGRSTLYRHLADFQIVWEDD
jgi:transcriptional regulator of acetoin/glycerol metabolism